MADAKETVTLVAPNGEERTEAYKPNFKVGNLLKQAVHDFGKDGHLDASLAYKLVKDGTQLDESQTLVETGVHAGDKLSVRSKTLPSDGDAPGVQ